VGSIHDVQYHLVFEEVTRMKRQAGLALKLSTPRGPALVVQSTVVDRVPPRLDQFSALDRAAVQHKRFHSVTVNASGVVPTVDNGGTRLLRLYLGKKFFNILRANAVTEFRRGPTL
jgi:hypothetical protein